MLRLIGSFIFVARSNTFRMPEASMSCMRSAIQEDMGGRGWESGNGSPPRHGGCTEGAQRKDRKSGASVRRWSGDWRRAVRGATTRASNIERDTCGPGNSF
jgi:hypothetical protein